MWSNSNVGEGVNYAYDFQEGLEYCYDMILLTDVDNNQTPHPDAQFNMLLT